ncbi:MAG: TonB-dependent receptor plug domain-containing protein [Sphingomonadales bacterium]|nr:TonB-dependent receptor plug domain-containing protein [Sphingomonadales bacterium]
MSTRNIKINNHQTIRYDRILSTSGIVTIAIFSLMNTALAAENASTVSLEEITVTATKTGATELQKTPMTITALTGDEMSRANLTDMKEIGVVVPNANFINLGGFSQAFIRGVGNTSQGAAIGGETNISFYLDGVYLERGMGANTEFFDVERIEVLRGPQGTLYGRNATGGAVNIITRMPTDEVDFKAGVTVGNYDKIRADASLAGPIVSGKVAGRISASINKHDGYVKNLIGPDLQDENSYGIRGKLSITPSDSIRIDLAADYYEQNNNGTVNQLEYDPNNAWPTLTAPVPEDFWSANVNGPVYDNAESYGLSATIAIDLPHDMTFRSITAYRNWERDFLWDADNNLPARVDLVLHDYFDTFTQEVQLDGKLDRLSWQTGFFYYELDNQ